MRCISILCFTLFLGTAASSGQTAPADSQMTQNLLAEIRQLRQDLQVTAATIQRVQIVMYRVQTEGSLLNRATERVHNTRARCGFIQSQRKITTVQIEQQETRQRTSQDPLERKAAEETLQRLKPAAETLATEELQCQAEQAEEEAQLRTQQAKVNDLQDQLDNLDRILAAQGRK